METQNLVQRFSHWTYVSPLFPPTLRENQETSVVLGHDFRILFQATGQASSMLKWV